MTEGNPDGSGENWQSQSEYIKATPEAGVAFKDYKTVDDAIKGGHEAMKKVGKPYWLPDDHSNLTDVQKNEIRANVAKMEGVPDNADGYEIKVPEGSMVDEQGIADFKVFSKENNLPKELAQKLVDFQLSFVDRLNKLRAEKINEMTEANAKQFSKDMGGDANAVLRMQWIKEFLQTKCTGEDGKPDAKVWESFSRRIMHNDRIIELPLLRALSDAAQQARGTGGAPQGDIPGAVAPGALAYQEMDKKK